jgi:hypothetical protein
MEMRMVIKQFLLRSLSGLPLSSPVSRPGFQLQWRLNGNMPWTQPMFSLPQAKQNDTSFLCSSRNAGSLDWDSVVMANYGDSHTTGMIAYEKVVEMTRQCFLHQW